MSDNNNALGRGLGSLFEEAQAAETPLQSTSTGFRQMKVEDILLPPDSTEISVYELPSTLVDSVRDYGVLQPLLVRKTQQGYMLIDGHKRLAAAKCCGLTLVPTIVMQINQEDVDGVRSAVNWTPPISLPGSAAAGFSRLGEDDTRDSFHGNIKWVYIITGVALFLFVAGHTYLRMNTGSTRGTAAEETVGLNTTENAPDPVPVAQDRTPTEPASDVPELMHSESSELPPVAHEDIATAETPPEHTAASTEVGDSADTTETTEPPTPTDTAVQAPKEQMAITDGQETVSTPTALAITGEGIEIRTANNGIRIVFERPIFRFRTVMSKSAVERIKDLAIQLAPVASELNITVVGHTDSDPMPPNARYADNTELGIARAETVGDFLVKECRLPRASIGTASSGESNPPYPNDTYDSRVRNRTVSLLIRPR